MCLLRLFFVLVIVFEAVCAPAQSNILTLTIHKQPDLLYFQAPANLQVNAQVVTDTASVVTSIAFFSSTNVWQVISNPDIQGPGQLFVEATDVRNLPAGYYSFQAIAQSSSGLIATSAITSFAVLTTNLLQNSSFETGNFSGWTLVGSPPTPSGSYNGVGSYVDSIHSGLNGAYLGDIKVASLSQTVATVPGQYYLLSLWVANHLYTSGNSQCFSIQWISPSAATNVLFSITNVPAFSWTRLQFPVVATDTNSIFQIQAQNEPGIFGVDDLFITPIPPPVLKTSATSTNGFQLSWATAPGIGYQLQHTTNLLQPTWADLVSPFMASGETFSVVDTNFPGSSQRFYRLVLP